MINDLPDNVTTEAILDLVKSFGQVTPLANVYAYLT